MAQSKLVIRKPRPDRLFRIHRINGDRLFLLYKRTVALWFLYAGMLLACWCTMAPWFLWPVFSYAPIVASLPLAASMMLSRNLQDPIFYRPGFQYPTAAMALLLLVMAINSGRNINAIFMLFFSTIVYMAVFWLREDELHKLSDVLTKALALFMCVSIPAYILHLAGFHFPHYNVSFQVNQYDNYRLFLVDFRFNFDLIPRFHSVFLEPAHLGMACIALLYSQIGKWNTWRCRVLFVTLLMTFSLAAYVCLVVMLFSAAWMKGKAVLGKILLLCAVSGTVMVGSLFYNKGDNMVNQLIVQRLTINEKGQLEGDNRATELFIRKFEKSLADGELFFGKGMEEQNKYGVGNSGYRVYFYSYGLSTGIFLLFFFYTIARTSPNRRAMLSMLFIQLLSFVAHAQPIRFYTFIPFYILSFSTVYPALKPNPKIEKCQATTPA